MATIDEAAFKTKGGWLLNYELVFDELLRIFNKDGKVDPSWVFSLNGFIHVYPREGVNDRRRLYEPAVWPTGYTYNGPDVYVHLDAVQHAILMGPKRQIVGADGKVRKVKAPSKATLDSAGLVADGMAHTAIDSHCKDYDDYVPNTGSVADDFMTGEKLYYILSAGASDWQDMELASCLPPFGVQVVYVGNLYYESVGTITAPQALHVPFSLEFPVGMYIDSFDAGRQLTGKKYPVEWWQEYKTEHNLLSATLGYARYKVQSQMQWDLESNIMDTLANIKAASRDATDAEILAEAEALYGFFYTNQDTVIDAGSDQVGSTDENGGVVTVDPDTGEVVVVNPGSEEEKGFISEWLGKAKDLATENPYLTAGAAVVAAAVVIKGATGSKD